MSQINTIFLIETIHPSIDPDLCRNATEYRNNHKHRNAMKIRIHFINIKSQKYAYKHDGIRVGGQWV